MNSAGAALPSDSLLPREHHIKRNARLPKKCFRVERDGYPPGSREPLTGSRCDQRRSRMNLKMVMSVLPPRRR